MDLEEQLQKAVKAVLQERAGGPPHQFSEAHERKMENLFATHRKKSAAKRKAVAAACIFLVASIAMLNVMPVSASMRSLLVEWLSRRAKYSSEPIRASGKGVPQTIPEGYWLNEELSFGSGDVLTQVYSREAGAEIVFVRSPASDALALNSDDVEISEEVLNGIAYHKYRSLKEGVENTIVWEAGGIRHTIFSLEPLETIYLMAISVE